MELHTVISTCAISILITLITIMVLKPLATKLKLVDHPGGRKAHAKPTPVIGGIAMYIGFFATPFFFQSNIPHFFPMLIGASVLLIMGILDDRHNLSARIRFFGQAIAVAILVMWGHLSIQNLGDLFSTGVLNLSSYHQISFFITLIATMAFINATNMIDGLDGLAGFLTLSQTGFLVYLALCFSAYQEAYALIILMGLIGTYLFFNMKLPGRAHASIFMGDAGSTFLAFIIAWFAVELSQQALQANNQHLGFNLVTVLWILAYPLYDLLTVMISRIKSGKSPLTPGRDHFHHLLIKKGFSSQKVVLLVIILSSFMGITGLQLANYKITESLQLLTFVSMFTVYFYLVYCLQRNNVLYHEKNQSSVC